MRLGRSRLPCYSGSIGARFRTSPSKAHAPLAFSGAGHARSFRQTIQDAAGIADGARPGGADIDRRPLRFPYPVRPSRGVRRSPGGSLEPGVGARQSPKLNRPYTENRHFQPPCRSHHRTARGGICRASRHRGRRLFRAARIIRPAGRAGRGYRPPARCGRGRKAELGPHLLHAFAIGRAMERHHRHAFTRKRRWLRDRRAPAYLPGAISSESVSASPVRWSHSSRSPYF